MHNNPEIPTDNHLLKNACQLSVFYWCVYTMCVLFVSAACIKAKNSISYQMCVAVAVQIGQKT